jgi:hypothetical protein
MELTLNLLSLSAAEKIWLAIQNLHPRKPVEWSIDVLFSDIANPKPAAPEKPVSSSQANSRAREEVGGLLHLEPVAKEAPDKGAQHNRDRKV